MVSGNACTGLQVSALPARTHPNLVSNAIGELGGPIRRPCIEHDSCKNLHTKQKVHFTRNPEVRVCELNPRQMVPAEIKVDWLKRKITSDTGHDNASDFDRLSRWTSSGNFEAGERLYRRTPHETSNTGYEWERGRFNAWASLSETKDAEDALSRSARAFMKEPSGASTWT